MNWRFWRSTFKGGGQPRATVGVASPATGSNGERQALRPGSERAVVRRGSAAAIVAAAAGAGLVPVLLAPETAEATYTPGAGTGGGDLVNTHLTVQGNIYVGTASGGGIYCYGTVSSAVGLGTGVSRLISDGVVQLAVNGAQTINYAVLVAANGQMGIGTSYPSYLLDVAGDAQVRGNVWINGVKAIDTTGTAQKALYAP